jgi:YD repeat-containing protein
MLRTLALSTLILVALGMYDPLHAADSAAYTYDANGRVATVTYANGTKITYTYDAAGNRASVVTACSGGGC